MTSSDISIEKWYISSIQIISAPFKIPKTQASCNLMALADSPMPTRTLADARDVCAHHCSPYHTGRPAAPEGSRTFGRYDPESLTHPDVWKLLFYSLCYFDPPLMLSVVVDADPSVRVVSLSSQSESLWVDKLIRAAPTAWTQRDRWTQVLHRDILNNLLSKCYFHIES